MKFSVDWVSHHAPTWDQLLSQFDPARMVEVGSCEGQSACWFLEHCPRLRELYCLDIWSDDNYWDVPSGIEKRFDDNIAEAKRDARVVKMKGPSHMALAVLLGMHGENYFDAIYIDGSHIAEDVLTDAVLAYRLVRENGLIMFDDYAWYNPKDTDVLARPKAAIDAFSTVMANHLAPVVMGDKSQMYFVKMDHRNKK